MVTVIAVVVDLFDVVVVVAVVVADDVVVVVKKGKCRHTL